MTSDESRWSRNDSVLRSKGTRRTATVTISAPEARCAAFISAKLRYFPVPTISRDEKTRPATSKVSLSASTAVDIFLGVLFLKDDSRSSLGGTGCGELTPTRLKKNSH